MTFKEIRSQTIAVSIGCNNFSEVYKLEKATCYYTAILGVSFNFKYTSVKRLKGSSLCLKIRHVMVWMYPSVLTYQDMIQVKMSGNNGKVETRSSLIIAACTCQIEM